MASRHHQWRIISVAVEAVVDLVVLVLVVAVVDLVEALVLGV